MFHAAPVAQPAILLRPPLDPGGLRIDPAALWRGRWAIAAAAVLAVLAGAVYAYRLATPVYRSHVALMVEPQETRVIDIGSVVPGLGRDAQVLNTQVEVLRSRELIGRLVDDMALTADPEFNAALAPRGPDLKGRLRAALAERGLVRPRPPEDSSPRARREATVTALIRRLDIAMQPESLVFTVSLATRDPEKTAAVLNRLAALYLSEQVRAKSEAAALAAGWLTGRVAELKLELETAEAEARAARARNGAISESELSERERQLTALRARAADALGAAPGLAARIAALETEIGVMSEALVAFRQADREVAATRLLYETFLGRLKETAAQDGVQLPDSRILSQAVVPHHPASPKSLLILAVAGILGAGAGALGVLASAHFRATFRHPEETEAALGLPVLAAVPRAADRSRDLLDLIVRRPDSAVAEGLRDLRSGILLSDIDAPPQTILITSAVPDEGKTAHSLMLAQTLASWGRRVLAVDADIRNPSFGDHLPLGEGRGLLSVLAGVCTLDEAVVRPEGLDADVLAGERCAATAADIFGTAAFRTFLKSLRQKYDFVVIDGPPVLATADAQALAAAADTVVLAVAWRSTRRSLVQRAVLRLARTGAKIAGVALTRVDPRRMARYGYRADRRRRGRRRGSFGHAGH